MSKYIPDENGELTALDSVVQAASQTSTPAGELGAAFAKMILTLVALVALMFASYWFVRKLLQNRLQKGSLHSRIQILEKRMISSKTMLFLIEVDKRKILIAESQLELKRLESFMEQPDESPTPSLQRVSEDLL